MIVTTEPGKVLGYKDMRDFQTGQPMMFRETGEVRRIVEWVDLGTFDKRSIPVGPGINGGTPAIGADVRLRLAVGDRDTVREAEGGRKYSAKSITLQVVEFLPGKG